MNKRTKKSPSKVNQSIFNKFSDKLSSKPPSRSTSPLPSTSTGNPVGETPIDSSAATPQNDHRTSSASAGSPLPATSRVVQNQDHPSTLQGPTTTTSAGQSPGRTSNSARMAGNSQTVTPNAGSTIKENLRLTGRFLQTLVRKAADIMDDNPAKVALGLVKAIVEIKNAVKDNKDAVARRIMSTGGQLEAVEEALRDWNPDNKEGNLWINQFKRTLEEELKKLNELSDESNFRKFLDHLDEQKRIEDIFERINEARVRFELALGIRVFQGVYEVDKIVKELFLERLEPSKIAHHDYLLEGTDSKLLHREICTAGTRVRILDGITMWAKDNSPDSPNVYWLFGSAGSGKSTIAYTIARRFEFAGDSNDTIILGGNFLCSRQFEETRLSKYIIRTVAYHLALTCKPFADALHRSGNFITKDHTVKTQIENLLVKPWSCAQRRDPSVPPHPNLSASPHPNPPIPMPPLTYLIVIDALDEIDGNGGSDFLRNLLNVVNKHRLMGLKFFVTSRSDPVLVADVDKFERKHRYRLQDVKEEEVRDDIATYINASLPDLDRSQVEALVVLSAGLFIYATTVVKYLAICGQSERQYFLAELLATANSSTPQSLSDATSFKSLDTLYLQILRQAFSDFTPETSKWVDRLRILHTFLCTAYRTSTSVIADLLFTSDYTDVAEKLLSDLHSVLYTENDRVLAYHKSFSDFIFDRARSKDFWCDQGTHHRLLTDSCFRIMKDGLKFNIANISSSFMLDGNNSTLADAVKKNIPPVLSYSCRNWSYHLSAAASTTDHLRDTLSDFLQLRALFWIEAMNLLGLRGRCDPMLRTAHEWVVKSKDNSPLAENLTEVGSFALYFSGSSASSSTPHLYISALATWPRKSGPCWGWKSRFPGIPGFTNASLGGTLLMTLNMDSSVCAVAVSNDGKHIVSGSYDHSVRT